MQLKILWVGKTRNAAVRALCEDYLERVRRFLTCEVVETREPSRSRALRGPQLLSAEADELERVLPDGCKLIVLDAQGTEESSPEFARYLEGELNRGTRGLAIIIGGPEGVDARLRERAQLRLSLGRMTWTHELCRVLLLEQLYRAMCIIRNIPYHK